MLCAPSVLCLVPLLTLLLVAPLCNLNSANELLRFCNAPDQFHSCIAQGQASKLQRRSRVSPAAARRLPSRAAAAAAAAAAGTSGPAALYTRDEWSSKPRQSFSSSSTARKSGVQMKGPWHLLAPSFLLFPPLGIFASPGLSCMQPQLTPPRAMRVGPAVLLLACLAAACANGAASAGLRLLQEVAAEGAAEGHGSSGSGSSGGRRRALILAAVGDTAQWPGWLANAPCGRRDFDLALM